MESYIMYPYKRCGFNGCVSSRCILEGKPSVQSNYPYQTHTHTYTHSRQHVSMFAWEGLCSQSHVTAISLHLHAGGVSSSLCRPLAALHSGNEGVDHVTSPCSYCLRSSGPSCPGSCLRKLLLLVQMKTAVNITLVHKVNKLNHSSFFFRLKN